MNLAESLLAAAGSMPDAVALVDGDTRVTYGELADRAARLARLLSGDGVAPGDRVAIVDVNEPAFVVSYVAALWAGAIAVPLNPHAPPAELARELRAVEARFGLCGADFDALLETAARDAGMPEDRLGHVGNECGVEAAEPLPRVERADTDVAALLFTAGTAGPPKAAMLTHGNLVANIRQVLDHPGLRLRSDDVGLAVLPFFHVFGLNAVLGVGLAAGSRLVLVPEFDAGETLRRIREHRVTLLAGVPAMFAAFLDLDEQVAPRDTFASVRLAVSGAASLPDDVSRALRDRFGLVVHDGYGLTEASPIVATSAVGHADPSPGWIGPPLPGVEVRLVDVDGADVLPGDPGEIWVRGPNVFPGYWREPEATKRALTDDGWLRTGDIAVADDAGALSLVDRAKDLVIVSGFNVYPAEVEGVLLEHPDVAEVAVVGEPHRRSGEAVVAFVVAKPGRTPSASELIAHCGRSLARYKCPTRVEVVDALPRSFVGKVLRRDLLDETTERSV